MPRKSVKKEIPGLLREHLSLSASEVARRLGVSRQAAHRHLRDLVREGVLEVEGAGRATRYRPREAPIVALRLAPQGLEEHTVWSDALATLRSRVRFSPEGEALFAYGFAEMLNNAIEHAAAREIAVRFETSGPTLSFVVEDDGVGIFNKIQRELHLEKPVEAILELSKGKLTTDTEGHTGEGIFFTSKAGELFIIDSGGLRWVTDNRVGDTGIEESDPRQGTAVHFEADPSTTRDLRDLFGEYTEDLEFSRTRTVVKLFQLGSRLMSRSEARRLTARLEEFREVALDFEGVEGVGQGFVDEVFRVFARKHPDIKLTPVNMNEAVAFMVHRGLGRTS